MSNHPRPHLSTLNRRHHQSAVSAAAYRLGACLYDDRQGRWHDYRLRDAATEVVFARTVAPPAFPSRATDPTWVWNAAEAAERRRDSQLARDYRVPIPYGLSVDEASELALDLAQFVADELTTSVSVGLHRDHELDALGEVKAEHHRGYHAHLLFPTRQLILASNADDVAFGPKLSILSNCKTSAAVVERFNAKWATLTNRRCEAAGLEAHFDHRSYVRQGLDPASTITLTRREVADERRGFFTNSGDRRRDIRFVVEGAASADAVDRMKATRLADRSDRRRTRRDALDAQLSQTRAELQTAVLARFDLEWQLDLARGDLAAAEDAQAAQVSIGSGLRAAQRQMALATAAGKARREASDRVVALEAEIESAQAALDARVARAGTGLARRQRAQAIAWRAGNEPVAFACEAEPLQGGALQ